MLRRKTGLSFFEWLVDISTITALVLQCINLPESMVHYEPILAYIVIFLFVISMGITIHNRRRTIVSRSKLMNITNSKMMNSIGKVVLFGGDLSWVDDYAKTIKNLTDSAKIVEVFFPKEKTINAKPDVLEQFNTRVERLKLAGAKVYCTDTDYHLRGTLINVEHREMHIILSKRVNNSFSNPNKNRYHLTLLHSEKSEDQAMCNAFLLSYRAIKNECIEY